MQQKRMASARSMVFCALFAALTVVLAQIVIPLPFTPVPISLGLVGATLSGGVLGAKRGAAAQGLYLFLGLLGLPVFSYLRGGAGLLFGVTGGYLFGYILTAAVCGVVCHGGRDGFLKTAMAMLAGTATCYLCGTLWYMLLTQSTLLTALTACVLPFLPGELLKIPMAARLSQNLAAMVFKKKA